MLVRSLRHSELTGSKPLDLINNTENKLGNYRIPKKPVICLIMSSNTLNEACPDPSDAERGTLVHRPPIPFIPEKAIVDSEKELKNETVELKFKYASTQGRNTKTETYSKKYMVFKTGPIELLLKYVINVRDAIKKKATKSPEMMFEIAEMLLGGDAKTRWDDAKLRETETLDENPGDDEIAQMNTTISQDTYDETLRTFLKSYLDKHSSKRQKQYMRNYIRKPRMLKVKMCAARLRELNGYLRYFPGQGSGPMPEDELVDILHRMLPVAWKKDLLKSSDDPFDTSLSKFEERLERLEQSFDADKESARKSNKSSKSSKNNDKIEKRKNQNDKKRKRNDTSQGGRKKFCHICNLLGNRDDNHNTIDCRNKNLIKSWASKNPRRKVTMTRYKQSDVNAMVEKAIRKRDKKKNPVPASSSSSDDSSSDSDSE